MGHGLFGFGARGLDALAGVPGSEPGDRDAIVHAIRMRAALLRGDTFEQTSTGSASKRRAVLSVLQRDLSYRDPGTRAQRREHDFLGKEPRWLDWTAHALFDKETHDRAEAVLNHLPRETVKLAVERVKKGRSTARKPGRVAPPSKSAVATLDAELRGIRRELEQIVKALRDEHYQFEARQPLRKPVAGAAAKLKALEKLIGPVPLSLARFWAVVGAVDLRGNHPAWARRTWLRSSADEPVWYADPLVVCSLVEALRSLSTSAARSRGEGSRASRRSTTARSRDRAGAEEGRGLRTAR